MLNQHPSEKSVQTSNQTIVKKNKKKLFAIVGVIILISVIAGAFLIPQSVGSTIELSLNYTVGEQMVYATTNIITAMQDDTINGLTGIPRTDNSTMNIEVVKFDGDNYSLKENMTVNQGNKTLKLPSSLLLNVSKTDYYKNLITGAPTMFQNYTNDPAISSYLSQASVKVGEVWVIPVNTGNDKFGLTGELTLTFQGFQDLTVPAGNYETFRIDISSSTLTMHADPEYLRSIHIAPIDNLTLQISGTTYLEQGTCRLVKSNLTQESVVQSGEVTVASTSFIEKILMEHTKV